MCLLKLCFFLFSVQVAFSSDNMLKPCGSHDIPCLSESTENFLAKTSAGLPQYNIKPIDPMVIDSLEVPGGLGETFNLKNVTVIGMKLLKIHDFTMDTVKRTVVLTVEIEPRIEGDITVEMINNSISGRLAGTAKQLVTARYTYDLRPDEKGVDYFSLGPEKITCEVEDRVELRVDQEAVNNILSDHSKSDSTKKNILCTASEKAYGTVIHNLRAAAKLFPKTAFFTDL